MPLGCPTRAEAKAGVERAGGVFGATVAAGAFAVALMHNTRSNSDNQGVGVAPMTYSTVTGDPMNLTTEWREENGTMVPARWMLVYPSDAVVDSLGYSASSDLVDPADIGLAVGDMHQHTGWGITGILTGALTVGAVAGGLLKWGGDRAVDGVYNFCGLVTSAAGRCRRGGRVAAPPAAAPAPPAAAPAPAPPPAPPAAPPAPASATRYVSPADGMVPGGGPLV